MTSRAPGLDLDSLAEFAAIPAPTGAEAQRLHWLEQRLADRPGERYRDEVGNLIWRGATGALGVAGAPDAPGALVMAHVDTVFDADTPLVMRRNGDELVGPGIGDNATAVMALVWTLERMPALPPSVAVAFTVGEEGLGNLRGARQVCADLRPEVAIAVEGHGLDKVITEHVGSLRARVTVTGPGGHSWSDRGTPSAIHALVAIADQLARSGANVGTIAGGRAVNAIAAHAEMLVELRSLEPPSLARFGQRLDGLTVEPPLALACEVVGERPAGRIDAGHPLMATVLAVRRQLGLDEHCGSGSTDANAAAALGIPAVAIGCARGSAMHTVNERIDARSLVLGCRQLEALLPALAG